METITIPKQKFGQVITDVEKLLYDFEDIAEYHDKIVKQRICDIEDGCIEGKTEQELDEYLAKRGVKI